MEKEAKRQRMESPVPIPGRIPTIGTHNGNFHCDEALACFILKKLPEYALAEVKRTRDSAQLAQCDVVVDVGGVYDPTIHRYDHHQRTFNESMKSLTNGVKPWVTKLSSAGLVYLHFGRRVIATITGDSEDSDETAQLFDSTYESFVEEVDAVDNGISDRDGVPRYKVTSTVSQRVGRLNPAWNDVSQDSDERFKSAMQLVGTEFVDCILQLKNAWMPARWIVQEAINSRMDVDSSGEIVVLNPFCPWKEHLFDIEEKMEISPSVKFVLFAERDGKQWRVQAVPIHASSFSSRVPLLEKWRGLRDEELSKISGIPSCVFVHASGFIGGNSTYEGVLRMARATLDSRMPS